MVASFTGNWILDLIVLAIAVLAVGYLITYGADLISSLKK